SRATSTAWRTHSRRWRATPSAPRRWDAPGATKCGASSISIGTRRCSSSTSERRPAAAAMRRRMRTESDVRQPTRAPARATYRWHDIATVRVEADDPAEATRIVAQLGLIPVAATEAADAVDLDIRVATTTHPIAAPENGPTAPVTLRCAGGARVDSSAYLLL